MLQQVCLTSPDFLLAKLTPKSVNAVESFHKVDKYSAM